MSSEPLDLDAYNHALVLRLSDANIHAARAQAEIDGLAAEVTRLRAAMAEAQMVIDFAAEMSGLKALDAARIVAERDRLRAAEQRVRALADQWRFWPTMSTTVDELLAALDGGQP